MKPLSLSKPHIIIMVGIPGAGKTFFAENFANTFKAPIISFDRIKKNIFGKINSDKTQDIIASKTAHYLLEEVLKTGRTAVYDGSTDTRTERLIVTKKSKEYGYEPLFVWVQTENLTSKKRATKNNDEGSNLTPEEFESRLKHFSQPHYTEKAIVISGKHTYNSQLKIVLRRLVEPRANAAVVATTRIANHRNSLIR